MSGRIGPKSLLIIINIAALISFAAAWSSEYFWDLKACFLCMIQRYLFLGISVWTVIMYQMKYANLKKGIIILFLLFPVT